MGEMNFYHEIALNNLPQNQLSPLSESYHIEPAETDHITPRDLIYI